MLRELFAPGEYYHVLGRGNYKQDIFIDRKDKARFLFSILYLQSPEKFYNFSRQITNYVRHRVFNISEKKVTRVVNSRSVELVSFCLMPNHFHLIVKEAKEGGISKYMQRTLNGFTKYHNTKYKKKGHLFEGPFKAVHIETDEQLLYLSAYIHRNPRGLKKWINKEIKYTWSSYQDYVKGNRWGELLVPDLIRDNFSTGEEYMKQVEESGAKDEVVEELLSGVWVR